MAQRGLCSRREADEWIRKGLVEVNGKIVDVRQSMYPEDVNINISDKAEKVQEKYITVALNKPVGLVSSQPMPGETPAIQLLTKENYWKSNEKVRVIPRYQPKLAVVGRLDKDSRGLLLFTQDGRIAKDIIGDSFVEKEYVVTVRESLHSTHLRKLQSPMKIDGRILKPVRVSYKFGNTMGIILKEGRNRQIRRMCSKIGLTVCDLLRIRIGDIHLNGIKPYKWKFVD